MAKTFKLQVVTPEKQCLNEDVSFVTLPGLVGEFGILSGHANMLSALKPGVMKIEKDRQTRTFRIGGGYAEVENDVLIVLAESLEAVGEA